MKKLIVSAFALAMMTTGAMAGEQLTKSQLDQVTAAGVQFNINRTTQVAVAKAFGGLIGAASASNWNSTAQVNVD